MLLSVHFQNDENPDRSELKSPYRKILITTLDLDDLMQKEQGFHEEMISKLLSRPFKMPIPDYRSNCHLCIIILISYNCFSFCVLSLLNLTNCPSKVGAILRIGMAAVG